jgi:hypothetical protein
MNGVALTIKMENVQTQKSRINALIEHLNLLTPLRKQVIRNEKRQKD